VSLHAYGAAGITPVPDLWAKCRGQVWERGTIPGASRGPWLATGCGRHQVTSMTRFPRNFHFIFVAAVLLAGCGSGDTPATIAEAFYSEMAAGNIEAAKSLSTPDTAEMLDYVAATHCTHMFQAIVDGGTSEVVIEEGIVRVSFVEGGIYATVPLVELDGEWKVDFATMVKAHAQTEPIGISL
jgi:uncharacterized protein YuzB (UPF0349 family)